MISIDHISKWYGQFQVLNDCTTNVEKGEVIVVCGPSGSGKSTLIKCVNALEPFQKGTVTVDVHLEGELPKGARPDLSVDGTVEIERLTDVLYVGRPAYGQEQTTVGMFKLQQGGEAVRTQVKLGRSSVNTIEVVEGLHIGDQVILSDMSAWDAFDRVRLN